MIADVVEKTISQGFRNVGSDEVKVILIEAAERITPHLSRSLSEKTGKALLDVGVTLSTGSRVTDVDEHGITVERSGMNERIPARTVLWAAGVNASGLGKKLADKTGAQVDRHGRIIVNDDLSIPGNRNIFAAGDLAHFPAANGASLPPMASVAGQQGRYAGTVVRNRILGKGDQAPFRYRDRGISSVIGRKSGIVQFGRFMFDGFPAWAVWLFLHVLSLIRFQNRLIVLARWLFLSFGHNPGSRQLSAGSTRRLPLSTP